MKYLYGLNVQGIQKFIFETSRLKEIVGASEMVEQVCTSLFAEQLCIPADSLKEDPNVLMSAAGHIRYLFDSEELCKKVVLNFPRKVMEYAPGITITQAIVTIESELQDKHLEEISRKLNIQKANPVRQHGLGLMISERSRSTGKPAVTISYDEYLDAAQLSKDNAFRKSQQKNELMSKITGSGNNINHDKLPTELKDISGESNSWIAIIHADGNNLGHTIQETIKTVHSKQKFLKKFSFLLDKCNRDAAKNAYEKIIEPFKSNTTYLPFRPVILGGDDITVITRGDLAVGFVREYLTSFENLTAQRFAEIANEFGAGVLTEGLTACAGIVYIKEKYPLHYGIELAENLCNHAKRELKKNVKGTSIIPSAILFHKVKDSFIDSYDDIVVRELTAGAVSYKYGPYITGSHQTKEFPSIDMLINQLNKLNNEDSPKSALRNWLTVLASNRDAAMLEMERIKKIHANYIKYLSLDASVNDSNKTHIYDLLTLSSIEN